MIFVRKIEPIQDGHDFASTTTAPLPYAVYRTFLVVGGSKSGKSKQMEKWATAIAKERDVAPIYLATMEPASDPENIARINRHKAQRAGRGFSTFEKPFQIDSLVKEIPENSVLLVECLGTLLSNEMFHPDNLDRQARWEEESCGKKDRQVEAIVKTILNDLAVLSDKTSLLILASNDIFQDAIEYSDSVKMFQECLARLHCEISRQPSVCTLEVTAGIPLLLNN